MALPAIKSLSFWLLFIILANSNNAFVSAREMPNPHDFPAAGGRLESGGSSPGCWDALWEIKSCMNEIEAYFINGTIDIGPPCCQAITTITRHCWPAVLAGVGVTPEESDILRGYCDAESAAADVVVSFQPLPSPAVVLN